MVHAKVRFKVKVVSMENTKQALIPLQGLGVRPCMFSISHFTEIPEGRTPSRAPTKGHCHKDSHVLESFIM